MSLPHNNKKKKEEKNYTIHKTVALIILLLIAMVVLSTNRGTDNPFVAVGKLVTIGILSIPIGFITWDIAGNFFGESATSLIFSSGKIEKIKHYSKARAFAIQHKFEEAIKLYQELIEDDKNDITAYLELAEIYHDKLKDYSAAFNCYNKIEKYSTENSDIIFAINRKVDIYLHDKKYSEAIEELEKIIERLPDIKDAMRAEERIKKLKEFIKK